MFSGSQLQLSWGTPPWGALHVLISIAINALCKGEQVALSLYGAMRLYSLVDALKYSCWVGKVQNFLGHSQFPFPLPL